MVVFQRFKKEKKVKGHSGICQEPDAPIPFGAKMSWLVLKEKDPNIVLNKLHCTNVLKSNWNSAFTYMQDRNQIFVTPCFDGYVLVLNFDAPLENNELLQNIAMDFEEIQFFSTHRVVELSCWIKYVNGKLVRSFYYIGDQGEIISNEGALTKEEQEVGLSLSSFDLENYDEHIVYPDEDVVNELAGKWGVHPFLENYQETKSTGFLCDIK